MEIKFGDIKLGEEIGYKHKRQKYIWLACGICGKARWVELLYGKPHFIRNRCKSCNQNGSKLSPREVAASILLAKGLRKCPVCLCIKATIKFYKDASKSGLSSACKQCTDKRHREYRLTEWGRGVVNKCLRQYRRRPAVKAQRRESAKRWRAELANSEQGRLRLYIVGRRGRETEKYKKFRYPRVLEYKHSLQDESLNYAENHWHRWTSAENLYLIENRKGKTRQELAEDLGRSYYAVGIRIEKLGLAKPQHRFDIPQGVSL